MAVEMAMPILVVDDYAAMRRIIRVLLAELGFTNIEQAEDGKSALTKLRQRSYGLVISDLKMQPMHGLELLTEIRSDAKLKGLPVIVVAAASDVDRVATAKAAGASDYIVKPFAANTLRRKLERVLGELSDQ
jgi:two-component system, chemotaxis family, chemotaxis protein CheY